MPTLEERVAHLEGRMTEQSPVLAELRDAIRRLDDRVSRQFMWLVGIQITTLAAIVVAFVSRADARTQEINSNTPVSRFFLTLFQAKY